LTEPLRSILESVRNHEPRFHVRGEMSQETFWITSVALGGIGAVILAIYVGATIVIAWKTAGQLRTLRDQFGILKNEFTSRTRPHLGFENLRLVGETDDGREWMYTLKNYGWGPATNVKVEWGAGETRNSLLLRGSLSEEGLVIFPQQGRDYGTGFETLGERFGKDIKFLAIQTDYYSQFGQHWTFQLMTWSDTATTWSLDSIKVGEGSPQSPWRDEVKGPVFSSASDSGASLPSISPSTAREYL